MSSKPKTPTPDQPLLHRDHRRPVTRRDFIAQGLLAGAGAAFGGSLFSLFANPRAAFAELAPDLQSLKGSCGIAVQGAGKIPFICFDLAGGASIAGSNVLVGGTGGQMDLLSTAGYNRLGLPGDMIPGLPEATPTATSQGDHTDLSAGLAFHADSGFLRGMLDTATLATLANTNGAVIPARSENDTGNNPHNPMYGIFRAGADGELLSLIGSRSSESGGNSVAPVDLIDASVRPTKIDRPSDVTGLVDTGKLVGLLSQDDAVAVMETIYRISNRKLSAVSTGIPVDPLSGFDRDTLIKELLRCGYVKAADLTDRYGDPSTLDPRDGVIVPRPDGSMVGTDTIFTTAEFDGDAEFRKTASVMKLVINGFAGAGTITMGGYDYHTGDRAVGELRDLRAGRCIGACLEYAARANGGQGIPVMIYVFSDGSVFSNGTLDNSLDGRGKGVWTGDNQSTAASFFLVYNPAGRPQLLGATPEEQARRQQIGYFRPDGSVETASSPAANNVNLLVQLVILNYLALHGEQNLFPGLFPGHGLGNAALMDRLTAFDAIVQNTIA